MTTREPHDQAPEDFEYETEYLVEYVDNRRTRYALIAAVVVLCILLVAAGWFVVSTMRPVGAPSSDTMPKGLSWVRSMYTWGEGADRRIDAPIDTAIAADGTIWVSTNRNVLVAYSPEGRVRRAITPELGTEPGQAISYEGVAVDEQGNVYACDYGRNIVAVYSSQGLELAEWPVQLPRDIAVKNGRAVVASAYGVGVFDTDGNLITKWGQRGKGEGDFDLPHGVAIGNDGNIYISDTQNKRIKAYTAEGRLLWIKNAPEDASVVPSGEATARPDVGEGQSMQLPLGMAIDGAGRLLVADAFEFQLLAVDVADEGNVTDRYGEFGALDGQFAYPTGLDYDANRDWFAVADTANNRVQVVRLQGSGGGITRLVYRGVDKGLWLCAIPLVLLLVAAFLMLRGRRNRDRGNAAGEGIRTDSA